MGYQKRKIEKKFGSVLHPLPAQNNKKYIIKNNGQVQAFYFDEQKQYFLKCFDTRNFIVT